MNNHMEFFLPLNDRQVTNKLQEEPIVSPHIRITVIPKLQL